MDAGRWQANYHENKRKVINDKYAKEIEAIYND